MNPETEKKPTFDLTTLLPILLGVLSLLGILLVFMIGRFNANRPLAPAEDTPTPFKYQLIGTEPGISTAETTTGEPGSGFPGESPDSGTSGAPSTSSTKPADLGLVVTAQQGGSSGSGSSSGTSPAKTKTSSSAILTAAGNATDPIIILNPGSKTATQPYGFIERTHTPSRTPGPTITNTPSRTKFSTLTPTTGAPITNTPSRTPVNTATGATQVPLVPSSIEYDDTHPLIAYEGWITAADSNAYLGTLHVSNTEGSTITFRFTGQQLRIKFLSSLSLGEISIDLGGRVFLLDEANGTNEWVSVLLAQGTYNVIITHSSGGSVNFDSIIIPDLGTPTPTP